MANFDFSQVETDEQQHLKSLRDRLLEGVEVVSPDQSSLYFTEDDQRWAETQLGEDSPTGQDRILVNDRKFESAGAQDYRDEVVLGESLHRLKTVDPERYERMYNTAQQSEPYMDWARASYDMARERYGEERPFEDWHRHSRFDQVIGGFLLSESQNMPSMQGWERGMLPLGDELRGELEQLENDLNAKPQGFDFTQASADIEVDPRSTLGQSIDTFKTLAAGVGQFGMFVSKGMWDSADSASRVSDVIANGIAATGTPEWLNPFRFTTEAFRILDEGLDIGDMHFEGMGDVADRIGTAAEILPELFPSFARLGVKSEEAEHAWDVMWKEGRFDLMANVVTDPEAWGAFIGNALPSLFLAWRSGGSLPFIGWLEALDAAENAREYEDITGEKISSEQFVTSVGLAGAVNAFLEKAGLDAVLGKFARGGRFNWLTGFVTGMAGEGGTEAMQEITQNLAGLGYDEKLQEQALDAINEGKWEPFLDKMNNNIVPAIMGGGGLGGPIGTLNAHTSTMAERADQVRADEEERRAAGKPSLLGDFGRTKITPEEAQELELEKVEVTQELLERVGRGDPLTLNEQYTLTDEGLGRFTGEAGNERVTMLNPGRERLVALRGEVMEQPVEGEVVGPDPGEEMGGDDMLDLWQQDLSMMNQRRGELLAREGELNSVEQLELDELQESITEREGDIADLEEVLETVPAERFHMEEVTPDVVVEPTPVSETFVAETHKPRAQREGRRSIRERIKRAVARTDTKPTEAQVEAGNYRKGHLRVQGVPVSVETPKGTERSGTDREGKKWSRRLKDNYGYIKGVVGKDKDQIDTFIGDYPESDEVVVINQKKDANQPLSEGNFDEHKVMLGYRDTDEAVQAYNRNYDDGGALKGTAVRMSMDEFKTWLAQADTTKIAESDRETLYRGETALTEGGPSYSGSRAVAQQFAGGEPIIERTIKKSDIYEATDVYAGDQEAVDAAIEKARAKGQKAVRLSEGIAAAPSVLVFDSTALRDDQVFPAKQRAPRKTNDGKGMSVAALQNALRPFYAVMLRAPPVRVVEAIEDLPEYLVQQLRSTGDEGVTNGVYTQDGLTDTIYLIANNTSNKAEGIETMVHEIIGHYGLHQIVPVHMFNDVMDKIAQSFPKEVREAASVQGLDFTDQAERRVAAEEFIAYTAQKILRKQKVSQKARQYIDDLVRAIQNMIRQAFGKDVLFTNGQVISMIAQASDYVQGPGGYVRDKQRGIRRHMSNPTYYSALFKAINDAKQEKNSPEGWKQIITSQVKKGKIKADEVKWSGIEEFLDDMNWGDLLDFLSDEMSLGLVPEEVYKAWDAQQKAGRAVADSEVQRQRTMGDLTTEEITEIQQTYNERLERAKEADDEWAKYADVKPKSIPKDVVMRFIQMNGVAIEVVQGRGDMEGDYPEISENYFDESELADDKSEDDKWDDYYEWKMDHGWEEAQTDAQEDVWDEHKWNKFKDEEDQDLGWDGTDEETMREEAIERAETEFDEANWEDFSDEWTTENTRFTYYAGNYIVNRQGDSWYIYDSERGYDIGEANSDDEVNSMIREDMDESNEESGGWRWGPDQHSDYNLPDSDSESYEEMLFKWTNPGEKELFSASVHWGGAKNFVAHVRFTTYEDENGDTVIYVDEIQSDWHKAIRKHGFKDPAKAKAISEDLQEVWNEYLNKWGPELQAEMAEWDMDPTFADDIRVAEMQARIPVQNMLQNYARRADKRAKWLRETRLTKREMNIAQVWAKHGWNNNLTKEENLSHREAILELPENERPAHDEIPLWWDLTSEKDMIAESETMAEGEVTEADIPESIPEFTWNDWLEEIYKQDIDNDRAGGGTNVASLPNLAMLYYGISGHVFNKHEKAHEYKGRRGTDLEYKDKLEAISRLILRQNELKQDYKSAKEGVEPAPFDKTWQVLVMKQIVREAVDRGHKRVFISQGEVHGVRWGSPPHAEGIGWYRIETTDEKTGKVKLGAHINSVAADGRDTGNSREAPLSQLHKHVGSDVAAIIRKDLEANAMGGKVMAEDVGRDFLLLSEEHDNKMTGSRDMYNVITPNTINSKWLKKYKTKMELTGRVAPLGGGPLTDEMEAAGVKVFYQNEQETNAKYATWEVKRMGKEEIDQHVAKHRRQVEPQAGIEPLNDEEWYGDWWAVYRPTEVGEPDPGRLAVDPEKRRRVPYDEAIIPKEKEPLQLMYNSISRGQEGSYQWLDKQKKKSQRQSFEAFEIVISPELEAAAKEGFPLFSKKSKKGKQQGRRTGDVDLDSALDWAELNIGPPKLRSIERLQEQFNKVVNIENKLRKAEQLMVDQFAGIKWAIHEHHGRHLSAEESGYKQAHFTTSGDSQMYAFLMHGLPEWVGGITQIKEGTKGLLEILEPVIDNIDEWGYWMAARRAKRLMEEGREHLFTEEKIEQLLKLGGDPETGVEALFPEFQTVADEYAAWNSGFLDWAQEAGVINAETRPLWENADYVPFYRIKSDELGGSFDSRASSGTAGIANQLNPIKRLKGGKERIGDITENILINLTHMASTAMKNQAVRQTIENLEGSGLIEPVKGAAFMKLATISMEDLKKKLKAAGVSVEAMPTDALNAMQKMWTIGAPTGGDIISVLENGKKKYYKVNETTLFRSLTAINQQKFNSVMGRMLMFPFRGTKRLLTSMITLAPGFMVANWFRDIAMAFVNSRHATWTKPRFDRSVTGALKALTQSKEMVSMMAAGGAFYSGYINAMDPGATTKSLRRALRKSGVRHRVLDAPWKFFHLYNDLGAASENANRIGHGYIPAIKAGATTAEAVWEAKDLMNFAKHGDAMAMQFLAQSTPFLNARVQGLVRWGQRLVEAPGATLTKSFLYTLAVMAVYLGNKDDERYKELPDEDKDMYIHFWINGHHWRLPKAFEVGSIFGTVPERMWEWMASKEDDRTRHALDRMKFVIDEVFMVNINPLHMIQLIKPFYEAGTNWNSFFRGPIVPEYMQDIAEAKPDMVYRPTTSPLARELATRMPRFAPHTLRNPLLLEHIMRGYTGTLGSYLMLMTDSLVRSRFDYAPRPSLRWDQTPMASRFYRGDDPLRRTGYENMMYEIRGAARGIERTINQMEKVGRADEVQAFRNDPSEYHSRYTNFQIQQAGEAMAGPYNAIRDLRNQMNRIWIDEEKSPEQKLIELNGHQQRINELTKRAYELRPGSSTTDYRPIASGETVLTVPTMALLEDLAGQDQAGATAFLRDNGLTDTADLVAGLPKKPDEDLRNLFGDTR